MLRLLFDAQTVQNFNLNEDEGSSWAVVEVVLAGGVSVAPSVVMGGRGVETWCGDVSGCAGPAGVDGG
jgi:hypothetical protein